MSLLVAFEDCPHRQILAEVGESIIVEGKIPVTLYPLDSEESIDPGDIMTCITCDEPRKVKSAV